MKAEKELKNFFYPLSVCILGASSKEKSVGYEILKSIKYYGYTGSVYPVNPNVDFILDYPCFKSIEDINYKIDLAVIIVPKAYIERSIELILNKGIKSIIIVTAGFKETGKEGEELENKILNKVKAAGARMIGPNCMGIINTLDTVRLNATFVAEKPETGRTAFFSQSGAIGAAVLNSLRETGIRFGHFISAGNKADLSENDIIDFWQSDNNIDIMTLYLESFADGEAFIKKLTKEKAHKPIIILKAGRSEEGIRAASSHTGALGSSDKVVNTVLDQFGIIRAENLNEMFNTSKGFESFAAPKGNRVAVVTNAGGPAILTVDAIVKNKLRLAKFSSNTMMDLRGIVRAEGSINNPVDLLPGGTVDQFKAVNEIVLADENVDAVISIFVEPVMVPAFEVVEKINSIINEKPVFQVVMPLPEFWERYRLNSKHKTPVFRNPEEPANVISNILFYEGKKQKGGFYQPKKSKLNFENESGLISIQSINKIAEYYNLPIVRTIIISTSQMKRFNCSIDYPSVLKGLSKAVTHKTELKAVKVDIKSEDELLFFAGQIKDNFEKYNIELEGYLIQPFIKPKHELIVGGFRDNSFGPMIMFGSGGKYVEYYEDTFLKSAYLCEKDLDEIIERTNIGRILKGVRGESPVDLQGIKRIIMSSASMMLDNPQITEFDFNPIIIDENNSLSIVDARIKCL